MSRRTWIVLFTGAAMVFLTMGIRQSIGLFLKPVTADLGTNRESFALALAAHNLILGLPLAAMFGPRYLTTLFGIVFLSHQVGAFLGVWLGGRVFDSSGGYGPVWTLAVVLGVLAALIHLPISVIPERSPQPAPAP